MLCSFFFSSRRRHTRLQGDWSSDVCSSDLRAGLPGPLYCDTSALLKLYLPEPGSDEFNEVVEGRDDVLVSDLAVTEIVSALAHRLRQGALARDAARRLQHAILGRLDEGVYQRVELTRD